MLFEGPARSDVCVCVSKKAVLLVRFDECYVATGSYNIQIRR